jgi:ABC-type bacteriocin/lantibiotic exporter with double-glycine peptidase domain
MPNGCLSVPHYRQSHEGACLPACARMVLGYLGQDVAEAQLALLMQSYGIGTPVRHIHHLSLLKLEVTVGPTTLSQLQQNLQVNLPSIVFLNTEALPYHDQTGFHAVVLVDSTADAVYLNDPAFEQAPQRVPLDYFMLAWSDFDYLHATLKRVEK